MKLFQTLLKRKVLIPVIIFIIIFLLNFIFVYKNQQEDNLKTVFTVNNIISPKEEKVGLPVHFKIPSIKIDANVEYVGIVPDGTMDAPKDPRGVAWYNLGPRPGENGSAVIDGHSGWKGNIKAIFDDLYKIQKGDKIYIEDDTGKTITFIVTEIKSYASDQDASSIFISNDGKSHLNLITCSGFWNDIEKSHPSRLVVLADRE